MTPNLPSPCEQKRCLRTEVLARRAAQPDKETVSREIVERLFSLPEYQSAETVLFYVDVRSEVRTRWVFPEVLNSGKCVVVPFCVESELEIFRLWDLKELIAGRFGILEPDPSLRNLPDRRVVPEELDLLIVPGVAFDRLGGRLGHGHGFYDRLLRGVRPQVPKIGLAFECQIVTAVPMEPHDVRLDVVVTEKAVSPSRISKR
jgi:5-formyltetrahydrofolate cyclo-ligase